MRHIWVNGTLTDWDDARVHVWDEAAIRGVSAFEGMLCVWWPGRRQHAVIAGGRHFRRLQRSASVIDVRLPFDRWDLDAVLSEASAKFAATAFYARPTAYVVRGRTSSADDQEVGWFVGAFPANVAEAPDIATASVLWPSRSGSLVPPDAKTGGSYLDFRVAEKQRHRAGAEVGLLVDAAGNLVEADGSGLLVVDDGQLIAPHVSGHALDSITRRILVELAEQRGLAVESRPVHWSQAHGSALVLGGTLTGVRVAKLQESLLEPDPGDLDVATDLRRRYYELLADESADGRLAQPLSR